MSNYLVLQDLPGVTQELTGPLAVAKLYDGGGAVRNVRHPDYGATYNGTGQMSNFDVVVQAAIDAGAGKVVVPPGDYILGARVRIRSGVTIEFMPGSRVLSNGWGFENYSYATASSAGTDYDIGLVGLVLEDNSNTGTQDGIPALRFRYTDRVNVQQCRLYQTGTQTQRTGVALTTVRDSSVARNNVVVSGDGVSLVASANSNILIFGNTVRGRRDLNTVPNGIALWTGCDRVRVTENDVADVGDECISVEGCTNCRVTGNTCTNPETSAIDVRGTNRNIVVSGNTCVAGALWTGNPLIRVANLSGNSPTSVTVTGNTCDVTTTGSHGSGIGVQGTGVNNVTVSSNVISSTDGLGTGVLVSGGPRQVVVKGNQIRYVNVGIEYQLCYACSAEDNHVEACAADGIRTYNVAPVRLTIRGNECANNGRVTAFSAGISVQIGDRIRLMSNHCFDDQGTPTQAYAILVSNTVTNVVIVDNNVTTGGLVIAAYNHANAPVLVRDNRGYVTRAKNSSTVASGTSTLSISHGLSRDFESVNNIRLTPRTNLGGLDYWVDDPTPGDGAFRINLSANAPVGGIAFGWEVWSDRMNAY